MKADFTFITKINVLLVILLFSFISLIYSNSLERNHFTGDTSLTSKINDYRILINKLLNENGIEGAAVALFDKEKTIWSEGFGFLNDDYKQPVSTETIFSIQSMSKTFTATAVMIAVQDGLLDLDKPIIEYLPEFKVNSAYEKNPEIKITLRLMLGNAAGFTHEAPVGNNFDASFDSYDQHYKSICDTWLKYPVSTKYFYSNLGFDLAAQIIEKESEMSFSEYMEKKIFEPLLMYSTTLDAKKILENKNRAVGYMFGFKKLPVIVPMIGAGGVYTSVDDLVKFVQLHLGFGKFREKLVLNKENLIEMYKPVIIEDYASGIAIINENNTYSLNHNGGGFGFGTCMKWFPEYNIGCIVLTNHEYNNAIYETASRILDDYIKNGNVKRDTVSFVFNPISYFEKKIKTRSETLNASASPKIIGDTIYKPDWEKYCGTHSIELTGGYEYKWYAKIAKIIGFRMPKIKVYEKNNALYFNYYDGNSYLGEQKLTEYQPGLFFTPDGEALDFRGNKPTYRNIKLN
jgi:CubicO group peptidase (beta-lactamase class C family)